jgi:transcriptional regulator with XRE-family HTH domain
MTPQQLFAAWLPDAMRRAKYDIDKQHGGARTQFAKDVGVPPVTITRWLAGQTMPTPDKYDRVAEVLGYEPADMLIESGIISSNSAIMRNESAVRSSPMAPSEAADRLGFRDPISREMFLGVVDRLTRTPLTSSDQDEQGDEAVEG